MIPGDIRKTIDVDPYEAETIMAHDEGINTNFVGLKSNFGDSNLSDTGNVLI